jgi:hypothetical protein
VIWICVPAAQPVEVAQLAGEMAVLLVTRLDGSDTFDTAYGGTNHTELMFEFDPPPLVPFVNVSVVVDEADVTEMLNCLVAAWTGSENAAPRSASATKWIERRIHAVAFIDVPRYSAAAMNVGAAMFWMRMAGVRPAISV